MSGCCNEYGCTRKKPYKIRQGYFTDAWYLVTDYRSKEPNTLVANRKHDITIELIPALLDAGWIPPNEGISVAELEALQSARSEVSHRRGSPADERQRGELNILGHLIESARKTAEVDQ